MTDQSSKNELIAEAVSKGLLSYEQARLFESVVLSNLLEMARALKRPVEARQPTQFGFKQAVMRRLDAIEAKLDHLTMVLSKVEVTTMSVKSALESLKQDVADQTSLQQSVVTLLNGLADQLRQAIDGDDEKALEDLHTQMTTNAAAMAAAVAANTPAQTPAPAPANPAPASDTSGNIEQPGVGGAGPGAGSSTQASSRAKTVAP